ncbi:MAG: hypothetical protein FJ100_12505 [Deltaproteobacteria bacterium]|nr:hypothetical protein [Deltaproteobacteria bacterium]
MLAAVLLLAMFFVSGGLALYSAWLLWRGEEAEAVLSGLPGTCEKVLLIDRPAAAGAIAHSVASSALAWTGGGEFATALGGLSREPLPRELDENQAIALCFQHGRWYGAAAKASEATPAGAARAFAHWIGVALGQTAARAAAPADMLERGGRWLGRSGPRAQWVARDGGRAIQVAWSSSQTTPTDTLLEADAAMDDLLAAMQTRTLQKDEAFRAAVERTGGGDVHAFERGPGLASALGSNAAWAEVANDIDWRAASLRIEGTSLIVHEHLGGGQRLAAWLKRRFDMPSALDASRILPAGDVERWGVDRYPHARAVDTDLTAASLAARRAAMPSSTAATDRAWASTLAGPTAWFHGADGCLTITAVLLPGVTALPASVPEALALPRCAKPVRTILAGHLVVGPQAGVEAVEAVLAGRARPLADTGLDRDARRLANSTNGWRSMAGRGLRSFEWTWVDTGIVVERRFLAQ